MKKRGIWKMMEFLRFVFAGWFTLASGLLILLGLLWLVVEAVRSFRNQMRHVNEQDEPTGDVLAQALQEIEEEEAEREREFYTSLEYDLVSFAVQLSQELLPEEK